MTRTEDKTMSTEVAKHLLRIGAVKFNVSDPFTWVSGIKSPIYCDNRAVNSDVAARSVVIDAFVSRLKDRHPEVDLIAGIATGGISFGALIADRLGIPFVYVRQKPKEHGMKKQVEGDIDSGNNVVLIEDHVSTGGSSLKAINAMLDEKKNCLGLMSIMQYGFPIAKERFDAVPIAYESLCELDVVLDVAVENGDISSEDKTSILDFRADREAWWKG